VKTYLYAHAQILAQHDGHYAEPIYFYLHDRLGSVRQVIDTDGTVKNTYTYNPWGQPFTAEVEATVDNPWTFTGQWYDAEIAQYFLRARMYDPAIYRFTARDPRRGTFTEPLELHRYLYCLNDPLNRMDPEGRFSYGEIAVGAGINATLSGIGAYMQGSRGWGLMMPIVRGAFEGGMSSMFAAGVAAKWTANVAGAVQRAAAAGMLTGAFNTAVHELGDFAEARLARREYEFSLGETFAHLGFNMIGGGLAQGFLAKHCNLQAFYNRHSRWLNPYDIQRMQSLRKVEEQALLGFFSVIHNVRTYLTEEAFDNAREWGYEW